LTRTLGKEIDPEIPSDNQNHFLNVTKDLILYLFGHLDGRSLQRLVCTCKMFYNLMKQDECSFYRVCIQKQSHLSKEADLKLHQKYWTACFGVTLDIGGMRASLKGYKLSVEPNKDLRLDLFKQYQTHQYSLSQEAQSLFGSSFMLIPKSDSDSSLLHCCVDPSSMFFFPLSKEISWKLGLSLADSEIQSEIQSEFEASSVEVSITFKESQQVTEHSFSIVASFKCGVFGHCTASFNMIEQQSMELLWMIHHPKICSRTRLSFPIYSPPPCYLPSFLQYAVNLMGQQMQGICFYYTNPFDLEKEYARHSIIKRVGRNRSDMADLLLVFILKAILVTPEHCEAPPRVAFLFVDPQYLGLLYRFTSEKGGIRLAFECWGAPSSAVDSGGILELVENINNIFLKEKKNLGLGQSLRKIVLQEDHNLHTFLRSTQDPIPLHVWLLQFLTKVSQLDGSKKLNLDKFPPNISIENQNRWNLILQSNNRPDFKLLSLDQVKATLLQMLDVDGSNFHSNVSI